MHLLFSQTALSRSPVEVVVLDDNRLSNSAQIQSLVRCSQDPHCHLTLVSLRNNPIVHTQTYTQIAAQLQFGAKLRLVPSHHQFETQLLTENNGLLLQEISGAERNLSYFATLKNYACPEKLKSEFSVSKTQIQVRIAGKDVTCQPAQLPEVVEEHIKGISKLPISNAVATIADGLTDNPVKPGQLVQQLNYFIRFKLGDHSVQRFVTLLAMISRMNHSQFPTPYWILEDMFVFE